ncbi:MAG: hypothetical protein ABSG67_02580, partial [Thermoguttaceae bacterium]
MPKHFFHITLTTLLFYVLSSNFLTAPCLAESPAQIQDIQSGVLKIPGMNLKVQFYADNIVRIVKWLPDGSAEKKSLVVIQKEAPNLDVKSQAD